MCSLHYRFKIISASLVFSLLLTSCNSQFTQSPQNQVSMTTSSTTTTTNSEEVNSNLGPDQSADLSSIANLFPTSGTVQSDHFSLHVSQSALDKLGIPNGYTVDPTDLEEMYKFSLAYWAHSLSQEEKDPSLTQFKDITKGDITPDDKDLPLAAYDQNAEMGSQGFNYYFDFGQAYNDNSAYTNACKNVNIAGVVKN